MEIIEKTCPVFKVATVSQNIRVKIKVYTLMPAQRKRLHLQLIKTAVSLKNLSFMKIL